jgi:hypothetical protein
MKGWFKDSYRHSLASRGVKTSFVKRTIDISPKPFEVRGKRKETVILEERPGYYPRHFQGDFSDVEKLGELSEASKELIERDIERPVEIKVGEEYVPPLESFGEKVKAFAGDFVIGPEPEADLLGPEEMEKVKKAKEWGEGKPIPRKESFSFIKLTGMEHLDRSGEYDKKFKMASPERIISYLEDLGVDTSVPEQDVDYYVKQIEADGDVKVPYVVLRGRDVMEYGNLAQLKAADVAGASGWLAVIRSKEEAEAREFDFED